ncbi:MAG: hypothetical protein AAGA56_27775 [Myxococcota bacterium]
MRGSFRLGWLLLLSASSCRPSAPPTVVDPSGPPGPTRLTVSFVSICCGTDNEARERLTEVMARFEEDESVKLSTQTVPWGKEGEVDVCFDLAPLSADVQRRFQTAVERAIPETPRNRVILDTPCRVSDRP